MLKYDEVKELVNSRFKCKTILSSKEPRPEKISVEVYGHHASYCTKSHRIWGFITESGRDRFMQDFKSVLPCE